MKYCLLVASLLFSGTAFSGSAGVIPYACIQEDAYVLMAFDPNPNRQAYAAFAGADRKGESAADTAAREFNEETRCVFDTPDASLLSTMTPSVDHGHTSFVSDWLWVRWSDLFKALSGDESQPRVVASLAHKYISVWDKAASSMRGAMRDGLLPENGLCK